MEREGRKKKNNRKKSYKQYRTYEPDGRHRGEKIRDALIIASVHAGSILISFSLQALTYCILHRGKKNEQNIYTRKTH